MEDSGAAAVESTKLTKVKDMQVTEIEVQMVCREGAWKVRALAKEAVEWHP